MSDSEKDAWGSVGTRSGRERSDTPEEVRDELEAVRPSVQYEIVQIAPVERFNCLLKNGQKLRLGCWVTLRHKKTGELIITGGLSTASSPQGQLTLAIDLRDFERFVAM